MNTRAEEIVRRNPGGVFPEHDREFSEQTRQLIQLNVRARVRGRTYSLFNGDDLEQESYLRVIYFFGGFRGQNFHNWVYKIVLNTFYSLLRADNRRPATSIEEIATRQLEDIYSPEDVFVSQTDVSEEVDTIRLMNDFLAWLSQRNAKHAKIVRLNLEGVKDEEIAERLDVAYRTVRSALYRAPRDYQRFLARIQRRKLKQVQQQAAG